MVLRLVAAKCCLAAAIGFALFTASGSVAAYAQTVEENPAPILRGEQQDNLPNPTLEASQDATPFGVDLVRIVIVDKRFSGKARTGPAPIDLSRAGDKLQTSEVNDRLRRFLGRPLSNLLVSEIRSEVIRYFRQINYPLVAVTLPPQEITGGVLTLEVVTFQVGEKTALGNRWTPDAHVLGTVRAQIGDDVKSDQLIDDLNWLNLNPYRNIGVVFEPGDKPGTTNLILQSDEKKPWSVWGGYSNSGARQDDQNRVFAGFNVANLPGLDHQLSYQLTASPEAVEGGRLLGLNGHDAYLSHSLSFFAPLSYANGWRHKASLQASYVQQGSDLVDPFTQNDETLQVYGEYAIPLESAGSLLSELYGGFDIKRQDNDVAFDGVSVLKTRQDIFQFILGARGSFSTPIGHHHDDRQNIGGRGAFDVRVAVSPGGITRHNTDDVFARVSRNLNASATYAYLYGSLDHTAALPKGFSISTRIAGQLSSQALPGIEQFAFGGHRSVRGYLTNEAAGDHGFAIQNALNLPTISLWRNGKIGPGRLAPYLFVDYGHAWDEALDLSTDLASVGVGVDLAIGRTMSASLTFGHALSDGPRTDAGDSRVYGAVNIRY